MRHVMMRKLQSCVQCQGITKAGRRCSIDSHSKMTNESGKLVGGPALLASSNFMIVLLSVFVFLPLCLMRNLSSLAIGSVIGTAGTRHARNCARHARNSRN